MQKCIEYQIEGQKTSFFLALGQEVNEVITVLNKEKFDKNNWQIS